MSKILLKWETVIIAQNLASNLLNNHTQNIERLKQSSQEKVSLAQQLYLDSIKDKAEREIVILKPVVEYFNIHAKEYHKKLRVLRINAASVDSSGNLEKDAKGEFQYKPAKLIELENSIEALEQTSTEWPVLVLPKEDKLDYDLFQSVIAFGSDLGSKLKPVKR
jgi:hypothetical protein